MTLRLAPERALLRRTALLLALMVSVAALLAAPVAAQTPPAAAPPAAEPEIAPGVTAPEAAPLDEDDMIAPPMVDPRAVETQNVAPAPDPLTRPDGFGDPAVMQPVPVLMKKARATWDDAFTTIVATLKEIDAEMARLKLKPNGASFIIYTSTDDMGFDFEAAVPFEGATAEKPQGGMAFSASPAGRALRFTHRGPYDAMDPTYEQIANLLDAKDLEAQDVYVEEYRADPRTTPQDDLVIDIWVPLK
ncbi:effector-binding domain-containing protein [Ancylobacter aquaticus]|uniref:Effector-binding domain-containing protein n=1 Tax=Ancylobacter aquaticus TaxID=100 RepID=A0A4R1HV24_ANCAQ|nr:GyrI-like domain-containing protein [Ancylobacter aquaticus]TCK23819.1 effector-binding domain-containing protein [Ancylobacter aquaticus]